jgi:zinc transport system substrate-binding protein
LDSAATTAGAPDVKRTRDGWHPTRVVHLAAGEIVAKTFVMSRHLTRVVHLAAVACVTPFQPASSLATYWVGHLRQTAAQAGRWLFALLLLLVVCGPLLSGCGGGLAIPNDEASTDGRLKVIASIFAPYDFCQQVTKDKADVSMLVPPGIETHSYEPTPADIVALGQADVFVYTGGESDAWLEDTLASLDNDNLKLVRLMDSVPLLEEVQLEGMQEEVDEAAPTNSEATDKREPAKEDPEADEHVWTSVANAEIIVKQLSGILGSLDPANAEDYQHNALTYLDELKQLDARFRAVVDGAARKTVVFADRFPFRYLAHEYGLECYAAFSGCSTAVDTNPQTIAFLIDQVNERRLPSVFYIELSSHRIADTVAEATGCGKLLLHSCHNISQSDFEAGLDYLTLMYRNANNLEAALS